MRLMSFFLTTPQFLDGTKTVTRRLGWKGLRAGDRVMAVRKSQGRKRGEPIERLGEIEIVSVRREPLWEMPTTDCQLEGFPKMSAAQFVSMFCKHMGCDPRAEVARIEFRKVSVQSSDL